MLPNPGPAARSANCRKDLAASPVRKFLIVIICLTSVSALTALADDGPSAPTKAAASAAAPAEPKPNDPAPLEEFKHGDWPFRPLTRPEVPKLNRFSDWVRNPVDNFIAEKLEAAKLEP